MFKLLHRAAEGPHLTEEERSALRALARSLSGPSAGEDSGAAPDPGRTLESSGRVSDVRAFVEDASENTSGLFGLRYQHRGLLGVGGIGEVICVYDPVLNRDVALKVARAHLLSEPHMLARFVEEAQVQAQLQHPNLVPIHEMGVLDDGRPFFTMDLVQGRNFQQALSALHAASTDGWSETSDGLSLRRLVAAFGQACRAVGHAHSRGVIHRDLKPQNLMLGALGEVRVVDWGLAKVIGQPGTRDVPPVSTSRPRAADAMTQIGTVSGTLFYMPPEQARGQIDRIDPRSDVYALGAVVYEILVGAPPYTPEFEDAAGRGLSMVQRVLAGPPKPVEELAARRLPTELVHLVDRAMARDPADRYPHGAAMAEAVEAWLDGTKKRARAQSVMSDSEALSARAAALEAQANTASISAEEMLTDIPVSAPEDQKWSAWLVQDEATDGRHEASLLRVREIQLLQAALTHAPDLADAHAALIGIYRSAHEAAEASRDATGAATAEVRMREHLSALPAQHPVRAKGVSYLKGMGALTLVTDPPGAEVLLERFELKRRRLVATPVGALGHTPLVDVPLEMGSYQLRVRAMGCEEVRYPVHISRGHHWDGIPPGADAPHPVWLPPRGRLNRNEDYVPAGWFLAGGDPDAIESLSARRVWVDGFCIARLPVTNRQCIAFLDDLVAQGREEEALQHAPAERSGVADEPGALLYAYADGKFSLQADLDGDVWEPDWPVMMVDWHGAAAYATWWATRQGEDWRLPDELEWEKAARGVDGRFFPWGDRFDPSWCHMRESTESEHLLAAVGCHAVDTSVYGTRDMAGNTRDWTASRYHADGLAADGCRVTVPARETGLVMASRGGSWRNGVPFARVTNRLRYPSTDRVSSVGIRLVRTIGA